MLKMNLNKLLLILILFFFSCNNSHNIPEKDKIENKIIFQTAKKLKEEKNLSFAGFGGSAVKGNEYLSIDFNYFELLDIEQARNLIIQIAQLFLKNLNSNEYLQKNNESPYEIKNLDIRIFCYDSGYSDPSPPNLSLVDLRKNMCTYYQNISEKFEIIHEESYEEALKLVTKETK